MTLEKFIKLYDIANSMVLLEGKRDVLECDQKKLIELGKLLASRTTKMTFRSGNAVGADQYFSLGIASVDKSRLQVIIPYANHRQTTNLAYETLSLEEVDFAKNPEIINQSKNNVKTEKLVDHYVLGYRDRITIKAAYIIRDTIKVLGTDKIKPATFGIFYDDLKNPMIGGTGHTMNVCRMNNIPIIDQREWFEWL